MLIIKRELSSAVVFCSEILYVVPYGLFSNDIILVTSPVLVSSMNLLNSVVGLKTLIAYLLITICIESNSFKFAFK